MQGYQAYRIDCTGCKIAAVITDFDIVQHDIPAEVLLISRLEKAAEAGVTE